MTLDTGGNFTSACAAGPHIFVPVYLTIRRTILKKPALFALVFNVKSTLCAAVTVNRIGAGFGVWQEHDGAELAPYLG